MTTQFKSDTYSDCLQSVFDEYREAPMEIKTILVMEDFASSADVHRERALEELARLHDRAIERIGGLQNEGHFYADISGGLDYILASIRNHDLEMHSAIKTVNALLRVVLGLKAVDRFAKLIEEALNAEAAQRRQDSAKKSAPLYAVKASS